MRSYGCDLKDIICSNYKISININSSRLNLAAFITILISLTVEITHWPLLPYPSCSLINLLLTITCPISWIFLPHQCNGAHHICLHLSLKDLLMLVYDMAVALILIYTIVWLGLFIFYSNAALLSESNKKYIVNFERRCWQPFNEIFSNSSLPRL